MAEREASWPRNAGPGLVRDLAWPKATWDSGLTRLEWLGWALVGEVVESSAADSWELVVRPFSPAGVSMLELEVIFTCSSVGDSGLEERPW